MAFGETLRALLLASGVKRNQLADALGYDSSYVCRWLTNEKLPSFKKHDNLFQRIAEIIVNSCDGAELVAVLTELGLQSELEITNEELVRTIETALFNSYDRQKNIKTGVNNISKLDENSLIMHSTSNNAIYSILADSIIDIASKGRGAEVNIITTSKLASYGRNERDLFSFLGDFKGEGLKISVSQTIFEGELKDDVSECCRYICKAMMQENDINYSVFITEDIEINNNTVLTAIKDRIVIKHMSDPFALQPYVFVSREPWVVKEAYLAYEKFKLQKRPLLAKMKQPEIEDTTHFINYMMQNEFWHILNVMHPLYLSNELYDELYTSNLHSNAMWEHSFGLRTNTAKKTVVLFKSAFLDYVYGGTIVFSGNMIVLNIEDRIRHLKGLLNWLKTENKCELFILEDNNPVLCGNELGHCVFISNKTGHATRHKKGEVSSSYVFNDVRLVNAFRNFIEIISELPEEYLLKGTQLFDFIENVISWLENTVDRTKQQES